MIQRLCSLFIAAVILSPAVSPTDTRHTAADSSRSSAASRQLVHLVWFKLNPGLNDGQREALVDELRKLDGIDQVNGLEIGRFADLGDQRALSELNIVMRMGFVSEEDYRQYQEHPVHLQLKSDIGTYLSGPPVTYDYWTLD